MGMHVEWSNAATCSIEFVPIGDEFSDDHGSQFDTGNGGLLLSHGADGGLAVEGTFAELEEFARRILRVVESARDAGPSS
jgi:hypothetical protein